MGFKIKVTGIDKLKGTIQKIADKKVEEACEIIYSKLKNFAPEIEYEKENLQFTIIDNKLRPDFSLLSESLQTKLKNYSS